MNDEQSKVPKILALALRPATLPDGLRIRQERVGSITLRSGRLLAADPLTAPWHYDPFDVTLPTGTFPVSVALLTPADQDVGEIALATIHFNSNEVKEWKMLGATDRDGKEFFFYPVDTATACFMDADARPLWKQQCEEGDAYDAFDEEIEKNRRVDWSFVEWPLDDMNMIAFKIGADSMYAAYVGVDENGEPVAVTTDFCLIDSDQLD